MKRVVTVAALLVWTAAFCAAQDSRGSIAGKIVDAQDAVIPGVAVVITNAETGAVSRTASNETGYFEVNLLNPVRQFREGHGRERQSAEDSAQPADRIIARGKS